MYFLGVGLILLGLKWFEIGMVATWSWWLVLSPFALAALWWTWADWSGYSKQQEVKKVEQRKQVRIAKNQDALRSPTRRSR